MKKIWLFYNIAVADLKERTRRKSFLIILVLTACMGILFIPERGSKFEIMDFDGYKGVYNSAWIGTGVALVTSIFLSLIGFYLVKNAVTQDERAGIGEIIASSPITRFKYCFGKFLSNVMMLIFIMCVLIFISGLLQLIRNEDPNIKIGELILPFLFITLPTLIIVSAIAIFFDCIDLLKTGIGSALYFFIWIFQLFFMSKKTFFDIMGGSIVISAIKNDISLLYPEYSGTVTIIDIGSTRANNLFIWHGINWTWSILLSRFLWVIIAVIIIFLSSNLFDRFSDKSSKLISIFDEEHESEKKIIMKKYKTAEMAPFPSELVTYKFRFFYLILCEIKLILYGHSIIWYIGFLCLFLLSVYDAHLLSFLYLWTIPLWATIGLAEVKNNTTSILMHTRYYKYHQLFAAYLGGVVLYIFVGFGYLIKSIVIMRNYVVILYVFIGAILISSISLLLNLWIKNSKVFELVYIIIWYLGPIQKVYPFDFIYFTGNHGVNNILVYILLTIIFLIFSFILRKNHKI